jgi:uncharacterized protein
MAGAFWLVQTMTLYGCFQQLSNEMIFYKNYSGSRKSTLMYSPLILLLLFGACTSNKENRLAKASSPYLQQHADNPVDWYEWSDEALAVAKKENKPLLISVGYASCHWCHQMEKESFMDTAVARIMNENFVCIKVDREERPDIDNIYMNACQLISGNAGWPLNAFALPDGKPFFAGTYYSKQSWISLLKNIANAYRQQHNKVMLQANALANGIANLELAVLTDTTNTIADKTFYQTLFDSLYQKLDLKYGGYKGNPKFPFPSTTEFLLQYHYLTKDKRALDVATTTLTQMALGGIYDHVGGGFARYSTDSLWRIPHFEKMLYDNGQLMSVYAHAYQVTGSAFFKNIVQEIAAFAERDLRAPDGGFYSSLNADTKEGEGEFYAWQDKEVKSNAAIGNPGLITAYYNVSEKGNWEKNKNILYASFTPEEFAAKNNLNTTTFYNQLSNAKKTLLAERNKREKPATDDKILTSWNALMLKGYIDAYSALGEESYLKTALSNARFLEKNMLRKDGSLWRSYRNNKASINGFLDDYALLSRSFIHLYQITFDKHWLVLARQLADYAINNFYEAKSGMFYYTSAQTGSVIKKIEIADNAIPSSNAVMAEVLYNLSVYFENEAYNSKASRMLSLLHNQMLKGADYYTEWCVLSGWYSYGTNEIAIVGREALKKNQELQKTYLPLAVFLGTQEEENLPLLEGKKTAGRTLIYVCTNRTCKLPVEETALALKQLTR